MSTHKHIDRICVAALVIAMIVTVLFMNGQTLGVTAVVKPGYEQRLFDTTRVHQIDIVMEDWDGFLETCENEEYTTCAVVIDGESYKNIGIRAKGNSSLSSVSQMGSDRYSLKIEFDHYNSAENYYGLDKLCLNNIIQDSTYMKDFLSYQLMREAGVPSPLCSYSYITVNGEDWGLYLAVEDIEDAFLQRNYGADYGELYKPDSQSMGGGRGNGKDFHMEDFDPEDINGEDTQVPPEMPDGGNMAQAPEMPDGENMAQAPEMPDGGNMPDGQEATERQRPAKDFGGRGGMHGAPAGNDAGNGGEKNGMARGSADVMLQYIDDDPDSYANIFDNAKTDITKADKTRLIESLKSLGENERIDEVVNVDEVIRYFVVHNFLCNGDSYTGSMVHNYYLYEEDGALSMLPWDYNLAFGGFQSQEATATVNSPIDSPVSGGQLEDRPMVAWIFADETYTQLYHQYFREFLENLNISEMISETRELIAPYVEKDPTKFYTYEDFEKGIEALEQFCELRVQSVLGQLDGTIPSTTDGQSADDTNLIDASELSITDMGSAGMGGGRGEAGPAMGGNAPANGEDVNPPAHPDDSGEKGGI